MKHCDSAQRRLGVHWQGALVPANLHTEHFSSSSPGVCGRHGDQQLAPRRLHHGLGTIETTSLLRGARSRVRAPRRQLACSAGAASMTRSQEHHQSRGKKRKNRSAGDCTCRDPRKHAPAAGVPSPADAPAPQSSRSPRHERNLRKASGIEGHFRRKLRKSARIEGHFGRKSILLHVSLSTKSHIPFVLETVSRYQAFDTKKLSIWYLHTSWVII